MHHSQLRAQALRGPRGRLMEGPRCPQPEPCGALVSVPFPAVLRRGALRGEESLATSRDGFGACPLGSPPFLLIFSASPFTPPIRTGGCCGGCLVSMECIGVKWVNTVIQVPGVPSAHCGVCSPPPVQSPSIPFIPPLSSSTSPPPPLITMLLSVAKRG